MPQLYLAVFMLQCDFAYQVFTKTMPVLCLAGRSAGRTYWSIAEGFLSTIVFAYSIHEVLKRVNSGDLNGLHLFFPTLELIGNLTYLCHLWLPPAVLCTGFAVWNIVSPNRSEIIHAGYDGVPGFLTVGGLDLFEYHSHEVCSACCARVFSVDPVRFRWRIGDYFYFYVLWDPGIWGA